MVESDPPTPPANCSNWQSDNTFVLTVSGGGLMTAQNSGSSTVTTTCQGVFARGLVTLNLIPDTPFVQTGVGANVFTIPSYVTRVKIAGDYNGFCENFIVRISSRLVVNEILGTCSSGSGRHFEGTYAITPGAAEVTSSTGINWTFTEVR